MEKKRKDLNRLFIQTTMFSPRCRCKSCHDVNVEERSRNKASVMMEGKTTDDDECGSRVSPRSDRASGLEVSC